MNNEPLKVGDVCRVVASFDELWRANKPLAGKLVRVVECSDKIVSRVEVLETGEEFGFTAWISNGCNYEDGREPRLKKL